MILHYNNIIRVQSFIPDETPSNPLQIAQESPNPKSQIISFSFKFGNTVHFKTQVDFRSCGQITAPAVIAHATKRPLLRTNLTHQGPLLRSNTAYAVAAYADFLPLLRSKPKPPRPHLRPKRRICGTAYAAPFPQMRKQQHL